MKQNQKRWMGILSATLLGFVTFITPGMNTDVSAQENIAPSNWTREAVSQLQINEDNTAPVIEMDELQKMTSDYYIWDTWPLQDYNGNVAVVNGYKILFALTVPSDVLPGKRHDTAQIRYFYAKDGKNWKLGGLLFNDGKALGSRQWAGSSIIGKDGKVHIFYTATGQKNETQLTYEQRIATTTGDIQTTNSTVNFANWSTHQIILQPDGRYYQTEEQSEQGDGSYAFRDPYFFQDPKTREEYLVFEANSAGTFAERTSLPNQLESSKSFNGSIGIAKAVNGNLTKFEMLPPLLEANGVNEELERPTVSIKGNNYYLFAKTHQEKFAPGLVAPEGLYGFISDSLMGGYKPLNESGLVIANPQENPYQAYSWMVMQNGTVLSFVQYTNVDGKDIYEIGEQSAEYQLAHFGGMLAPSLKLSITGDQTKIVHEKRQGAIH